MIVIRHSRMCLVASVEKRFEAKCRCGDWRCWHIPRYLGRPIGIGVTPQECNRHNCENSCEGYEQEDEE